VQNVETVLSELLKSAEMHDRREAVTGESASDGSSYRRQLTVEDLFKGESSIIGCCFVT